MVLFRKSSQNVTIIRITLFLLCLLLFASAGSAEAKKTITPEGIVNLRVVRHVQVSPDGKRIAFAAGKRSDFDQLRESKIWLISSDGGSPQLLHNAPQEQSLPYWSPDGRVIAFLAGPLQKKEGETDVKQIWMKDLQSSDAVPLTNLKGGVDTFRWSPDGRSIAFTATDPQTEQEERKAKEKDDAIVVDRIYKYSRLWRLNLFDQTIRPIFPQAGNVNDFDWSPDGTQFAIKISKTPLLDDVYWRSKLLIISAQNGEIVRTIDEKAGSWINVAWSPDGKSIAYSHVSPGGIAEWRMIAPVDGSAPKHIDDHYNGTILGMKWLPDSKSLIGITLEGTVAKLVRIDATDHAIRSLAEFRAPYADFSISADGQTVAFVAEQPDSPANVWTWKIGGTPQRLTNLQAEVASWNVGSMREIMWKNKKDQTPVYGLLITPPGYQQNHAYPTIVQIHGGPEWAWWSGWHGSWHEWGQLLASNGYVVLLPNPRGSDGQNWRFIVQNIEDWGGMDYEDILSGLDFLIAEKITDPKRIGIGGWSYGGFISAWAVTHTDRFRAAVVGAAVTNLFSMSGTGDIPTFLNQYFKGTPFDRREVYDAHSPMTYLKNCKTPSLVLHGEADLRVPISQGWEFYNGLKMLGVPTEMVVYPREAHGFTEDLHQRDLLQRVLDWYQRYLH